MWARKKEHQKSVLTIWPHNKSASHLHDWHVTYSHPAKNSDVMMKSELNSMHACRTTRFSREPLERNDTFPRITSAHFEVVWIGIFPNFQVIVRSKKKRSAFKTIEYYAWIKPIDAEKATHSHCPGGVWVKYVRLVLQRYIKWKWATLVKYWKPKIFSLRSWCWTILRYFRTKKGE